MKSLYSGVSKIIKRKIGTTEDTRLSTSEVNSITATVGSIVTIVLVAIVTLLVS